MLKSFLPLNADIVSAMVDIIASLITSCGPLQIFSLEALEVALSKISRIPTHAGSLSDEAPAPLPPPVELLDGFTINQWAAYAKLKSQVASRMCHENGLMKRKLVNLDNCRSALPPAASAEKGDPLFAEDPWQAASSKLAAPRNCAASTSVSSEAHLWTAWSPTPRHHDIAKEPARAHSDVDIGSSCLAAQCRPSLDDCSSERDDLVASSSATETSKQSEPPQPSEPEAMDGPASRADGDGYQLATMPAMAVCAEGLQPRDVSGAWFRTTWPSSVELSADDVMEHFEAYGEITELEWLENASDKSVETIKLHFKSRSSLQQVLARPQHSVRREADGKLFTVKTHVKFTDNAVGGQVQSNR
jgi:hypothetical protein